MLSKLSPGGGAEKVPGQDVLFAARPVCAFGFTLNQNPSKSGQVRSLRVWLTTTKDRHLNERPDSGAFLAGNETLFRGHGAVPGGRGTRRLECATRD